MVSMVPFGDSPPLRCPHCDDDEDFSLLALAKGSERYVFLFIDAARAELLRTLSRFAADPALSFTWFDAARLGQRVRIGCE